MTSQNDDIGHWMTNKGVYLTMCDHWEGRRKEMFYLMTHSTYFIYGYMVSHIW